MKENIVNALIRDRTIQATKNNIHGKLVCVARNMGSPIMGHYFDNPITEQEWANFNNAEADWSKEPDESLENGNLPKLGFVYDSLKIGVNLEIVVMVKEKISQLTGEKELDKPSEIRCSYRGYQVYHEVDSVIKCYAPFPEWEDHLNTIYNYATGRDNRRKANEKEEVKQVRKKASKKALESLRRLWGI